MALATPIVDCVCFSTQLTQYTVNSMLYYLSTSSHILNEIIKGRDRLKINFVTVIN